MSVLESVMKLFSNLLHVVNPVKMKYENSSCVYLSSWCVICSHLQPPQHPITDGKTMSDSVRNRAAIFYERFAFKQVELERVRMKHYFFFKIVLKYWTFTICFLFRFQWMTISLNSSSKSHQKLAQACASIIAHLMQIQAIAEDIGTLWGGGWRLDKAGRKVVIWLYPSSPSFLPEAMSFAEKYAVTNIIFLFTNITKYPFRFMTIIRSVMPGEFTLRLKTPAISIDQDFLIEYANRIEFPYIMIDIENVSLLSLVLCTFMTERWVSL